MRNTNKFPEEIDPFKRIETSKSLKDLFRVCSGFETFGKHLKYYEFPLKYLYVKCRLCSSQLTYFWKTDHYELKKFNPNHDHKDSNKNKRQDII